jgi:hypothetical protein
LCIAILFLGGAEERHEKSANLIGKAYAFIRPTDTRNALMDAFDLSPIKARFRIISRLYFHPVSFLFVLTFYFGVSQK